MSWGHYDRLPNVTQQILTKHYFSEIIIIVLDSAVTQFHQVLPSVCNPKLKLDFVTIPDDADMGTADALRYIKDKVEVSIKFLKQIIVQTL